MAKLRQGVRSYATLPYAWIPAEQLLDRLLPGDEEEGGRLAVGPVDQRRPVPQVSL